MTEQTAKETAIIPATVKPDLSMTQYGSRQDVEALARRIQSLLPSGSKLSLEHAMAAAQYAILTDANIFRGEIYAWDDKHGNLVLDDGYKILVRWAKDKCAYSEKWEPMDATDLPDGAIGMRCWILRDDARPLMAQLIQAGTPWREAFEIAATYGIGVVRREDMFTRDGQPIQPPKTWTWQTRAETRALKNALNRSHGAPSPREIAAMSWDVNGTHTIAADWEDCPPGLPAEAREHLAEQKATARLAPPDLRAPEQVLAAGNSLLHQSELEI